MTCRLSKPGATPIRHFAKNLDLDDRGIAGKTQGSGNELPQLNRRWSSLLNTKT